MILNTSILFNICDDYSCYYGGFFSNNQNVYGLNYKPEIFLPYNTFFVDYNIVKRDIGILILGRRRSTFSNSMSIMF